MREDVGVSNPDRVAVAGRQEPRVHLVEVFLDESGCALTSFLSDRYQTARVQDALRLTCTRAGDECHVLEVCEGLSEHATEQGVHRNGRVLNQFIGKNGVARELVGIKDNLAEGRLIGC